MVILSALVFLMLSTSCALTQNVPSCGVPKVEPQLEYEDRILGGDAAVPGSWPWNAAIHTKSNFRPEQFCGGALVSDRHVITAAHCVRTRSSQTIRVHLGSYKRTFLDSEEVAVDVQEVCLHRNFTGHNDIAIITLNRPVNFTDHIIPACLPTSGEAVESGTVGYITGWGINDPKGEHASPTLKQVKTRFLKPQKCSVEFNLTIPGNTICGTHDYGSTCEGDSGGPVVQKKDDRWLLQGVLSGGPHVCGDKKYPMLFTEISSFLEEFIYPYMAAETRKEKALLCSLL
ncbi:unnamed protein product [Ixodes persulcatus]